MRVQLPNGTIIEGVPEGTTKDQIMQKAISAGLATAEDFGVQASTETPTKGSLTPEQFADMYGDQPDIEGLIAPSQPKPDAGIGEKATGVGEAALTAGMGMTFGTMGMIHGTLKGIAEEIRSGKFGTQEAANRIGDLAAKMSSDVTYSPRTETGQEYVQALGEAGEALAPLAGLGGELAMIGQVAKKSAAPKAAEVARNTVEAVKPVKEVVSALFEYQTPAKRRIAELLEQYDPDVTTANYRLSAPSDPSAPKSGIMRALGAGSAKIEKDPVSIEAIKQGYDKGIVSMIKGSAPSDKNAMRQMLEIYEKGQSDALFRAKNRPAQVVGQRLVDSISEIRKANRKAGADIDKAANGLKGKAVDAQPIGVRFIDDLESMGINVDDNLKLSFKGSDIEGVPPAERVISTVFNRMTGPKTPDAYELHRLKRFIDEQVSYGKAGEGLTGRAERALKTLRRDIDSTLDKKFADYDSANTIYSDTIGVLDEVQTVAGKRVDLSGPNAAEQLGTLMRRVLSNAQSRASVMDMAMAVDETARKYPSSLMLEGKAKGRRPEITTLVLFSDELDRRFKPVASTSFQGQIEQVADRGRSIAQSQSPTMAVIDEVVRFGARGIDKAKGRNDTKAYQIMKDLLNEER